MHLRGFLKAGHWPTLVCAFLYFDISFMVWVLLGALANSFAAYFVLGPAQRGFLLALPLLGGSLLRLVLGDARTLRGRAGRDRAQRGEHLSVTCSGPPHPRHRST